MRRLIAGLCCLMASVALAAPVCVDSNPAAAAVPDHLVAGAPGDGGDGGIGGTGHQPPDAPERGGVGGTGAQAGIEGGHELADVPVRPGEAVGIVGVVTGFGSICVNGMRLEIDAATPVSENGRRVSAGALAVGQFVSIDARATDIGLQAREVAIVHLMEGPVSDRAGGGIAVMGQQVDLLPDARVAQGLTPGTLVQVSGMRTPEGLIRATRIVRAPGLTEATVIGDITRPTDGVAHVEGLRLRGDLLAAPAARGTGQVMLTGRWDGDALIAGRVAADPTFHFTRHTDKVVLEALISGTPAAGDMTACGLSVRSGRSTLLQGTAPDIRLDARRVRISGRVQPQGVLDALRIDADLPGQSLH